MVNRTGCEILQTMRKLTEFVDVGTFFEYRQTMSYYIEEIQGVLNKMESGLYDKHDYERVRRKTKSAKAKLAKLEAKIEAIEGEQETTIVHKTISEMF